MDKPHWKSLFPNAPGDRDVLRRLWARLDVRGPDECWEMRRRWARIPERRSYYGLVTVDGRPRLAHRTTYEAIVGPIPDGLCVLHSCDNPPCCNPAHLHIGTKADNSREMVERGRSPCGDRNGSRLHPESRATGDRHGSRTHPESRPRGDKNPSRIYPERLIRGDRHWSRRHPERRAMGERNGHAILTESDVLAIRGRHDLAYDVMAAMYGVSAATVRDIAVGRTWRHVGGQLRDFPRRGPRTRRTMNGLRT